MAAHAGDSATKESVKDKRVPLKEVAFIAPTKIPGVSVMLTTLEAGVRRVVDGKDWHPPQMWFDPERRLIKIADAAYPLERVHYFIQAPSAITKVPPPLDLEKYTIRKGI
jgi:hypothetical protein